MKSSLKNIWGRVWPILAVAASLLLLLEIGHAQTPIVIPSVSGVFSRLFEDIASEPFWKSLGFSMYRLGIGYPLACVLGGFFGILAGLFSGFGKYLRRLIAFLQSIPPITWLPFLIVLYGFGDIPIIVIVTIASFFPMALSVMNGAEGVNRTHLEVAKVLGAGRVQLLRKVYLPETLPAFITGAQVAFGNAWRSLIAGEMVGGVAVGLGFASKFAGEIADMRGLIMYIAVIGVIASILDQVVLEQLKRRLLRWRYVNEGEAK